MYSEICLLKFFLIPIRLTCSLNFQSEVILTTKLFNFSAFYYILKF